MAAIGRAYLAGFFDGEGHIGTVNNTKHCSMRMLRVSVCNTDPVVLREYQRRYGGYLCVQKAATGNRRAIWQWTAKAIQAEKFLRSIQPHVVVKAEHLRLALELQRARRTRQIDRVGVLAGEISKRNGWNYRKAG